MLPQTFIYLKTQKIPGNTDESRLNCRDNDVKCQAENIWESNKKRLP